MHLPQLLRLLRPAFLLFLAPCALLATPVAFNLPAQPGDTALLAFAEQAGVDVLFSFDELHRLRTPAIVGEFEPEAALIRLLENTGCLARRNGPRKYIVTLTSRPTGTLRGHLLQPDNRSPAAGLNVTLSGTAFTTSTGEDGSFEFASVPPGRYRLTARGQNYRELTLTRILVNANRLTSLTPQAMQVAGDVMQLEPFVVEASAKNDGDSAENGLVPFRIAAGNLDLPRSVNDALAFQIYDRDQLTRSGVINLNDFLQREVLDSNGATLRPDPSTGASGLFSGSTNLNLRGFGVEETVILVNGRRLPEVLTNLQFGFASQSQMPDVNFIPLSMVQQVEVLPVSASSLYTGNPVGGVINIVLRPDLNATEVTTTYSNPTGGYDAPQSAVTLQHGRTLLNGRLHLRLSASRTTIMPAQESELGLIAAKYRENPATSAANLYRATPNVRSADGSPLFGSGTPAYTSVGPGANGTGGLAAFAGRAGRLSEELFQAGPGLVTSPNSTGFAYGHRQQRSTFFGSAVYDVFPWLQLGVDGTFSRSVIHPGLNLFSAELLLPAGATANPFGQDVIVSLNETASRLGERYNEARLESSSLVFAGLLKLPSSWRVSVDAQWAHSLTRYHGLSLIRTDRWQDLVNAGIYNPLRDTQVFAPPQEFYDRVLVHYGRPGSLVTLGDYTALDAALRLTNQALPLPTGDAALNLGMDYRRNTLGAFSNEQHFGDGSLAGTPDQWSGRTLQRWSVFGELQAPLVPAKRLPAWIRSVEGDLALRYVGARTEKESYLSPTVGLKIAFARGLAFRSSFTTSSRYPTPYLSRQIIQAGGGPGGVNNVNIRDPLRGNVEYTVGETELLDYALAPESAVTQTAGFIYEQGQHHRLRASLDFFDTRKTNELVALNPQMVMTLEHVFPERVNRAALPPGDPFTVGPVTNVSTGTVNLASRHSQNWNADANYQWNQCFGGTLQLKARLVYFQRYEREILPTEPAYDELAHPSGTALGLLKYRANLGAGWSNRSYGFGLESRYYHSRVLPLNEQLVQGSPNIAAHWQFDAYLQGDLRRWLPGGKFWDRSGRSFGLQGQLRIDNLLNARFPRYAFDATTGVQPYGDWRGRTYSVSLTATY